ncbi:hypothetical protein Marshall_176 [Salmonella phage Marshall]|uniref:Uncharacterized protein n=5 Tax=Kuttervirus TaxID=2169536 RepID=A0A2Z5HMN5_9CAUD|nr:hypothetical protein Marshall_176 [Salmonella phage Marshall]YP_009880597.1 hypothetical protein HYP66_gp030 [Salmonella phage S118]AYC62428.1 hypothetical protein vBEcoMSa157lw_00134 [Escherichia phage vB_EcoM_Sa157lw]EGJ6623156.1 hypothetical protein [Salmonella enterica]UCR90981.1 hypothetical protein Sa157lw_00032 [Escherichia phage Sa157lw]WQZ19141.1 hypothetical protein HNGLIVSP_CDS0058 [Escherichia phage 241]AGY47693.1 hypothetical protein Marshall_176 [Salmonella phage Marshall]
MKQYHLNYSLVRSEDRKELWRRQFVYTLGDKNQNLGLRLALGVLVTDVIEIFEKDVVGPLSFGHQRVVDLVGSSLDSVDRALTMYPLPGERKIITKSDCDFSTNYTLTITVEDIVPEKPRNRIVERFARLLRGE